MSWAGGGSLSPGRGRRPSQPRAVPSPVLSPIAARRTDQLFFGGKRSRLPKRGRAFMRCKSDPQVPPAALEPRTRNRFNPSPGRGDVRPRRSVYGPHASGHAPLLLSLSGRDDAFVVVDWREQIVGLITLAWLALIKVRTYKLYAMIVLVVDECPDGVTRCSSIIGKGRPRRKAQAWRCADC